jgi:hypothetical protein
VVKWEDSCPRCLAAGQRPEHFGSDRQCAFATGVFSYDNWQCMTALDLRALAGEDHYGDGYQPGAATVKHNDQSAALLANPADGCLGFVVLGWYKSRGRTEYLGYLDETKVIPLTLEMAEEVLRGYSARGEEE